MSRKYNGCINYFAPGSGAWLFVGILSAKLTNYRIEQLEKKVDKHNTVVERTYKLEQNFLSNG